MHNSFTSGPYGSPHVFFYAIFMDMESYQEINARTISGWVDEGWQWGRPIAHETYEKAKAGSWDMLLTPTIPVPHDWFGQLRGKSVLGLASGGGQQMPVFNALGAECTLLDLSDRQLDGDRMVAQREGYSINIIKADMVKPGAVVIDVGMNRRPDGKLTGDVDYAAVEPVASAITPVPGGVGPMTITMLLRNTLTAARKAAERQASQH